MRIELLRQILKQQKKIVDGKRIISTVIVTTENIQEDIKPTNETTAIVAVLDRSGSMEQGGFIHTAISKFNEYIAGQKLIPGNATLSVMLFDDYFNVIIDNVDLMKAEPLTNEEWSPRGMTRLFDAVGKSITETKWAFSKMNKSDIPSKVLVVILTDGGENDSKEYNQSQIKEMIRAQEELGWNFIFLGANQDSFKTASGMGISYGNTMNFVQSDAGAAMYTSTLSNASSKLRSMTSTDGNYRKMSKSLITPEEEDN